MDSWEQEEMSYKAINRSDDSATCLIWGAQVKLICIFFDISVFFCNKLTSITECFSIKGYSKTLRPIGLRMYTPHNLYPRARLWIVWSVG